jgi:phosphoribosyl 1,2-cyclic phosphate phosphodiesterase
MRLTILGSGGSTGVPGVGIGWGKCDPDNPKNRRTRPSILIENDDTAILIDTSPDMREQILRHDVTRLDALILTHGHADHLHGIDDIRGINKAMSAPIDLFTNEATLKEVEKRFAYTLEPLHVDQDDPVVHYYKPVLNPREITGGETFSINSIPITVMDQDHGYSRTLGFRFGPIAYTTDLVHLSDHAIEVLDGVHTWVIGAPILFKHPTHIHVDGALEWIEKINPERAVISHLGVSLDYETLCKDLPDRVEPAYDGMVIEVESCL